MTTATEIDALFETYKDAVYHKDLDAFASIFDENVRIFDIWQQWSYDGLPAWREMAKGWFSSLGTDRDSVMFDEVQIQEAGDMAVATAIMRFTNVSDQGEELRFLENRLTWVAQKKTGVWKIIHEHTSSPVDFNTMKVILQR